MTSTIFQASNWCEERSGSLLGRFTLSIRHMGLIFDNVGFHQSNTRLWVTMPSLTFEEKNGRRRYVPMIRFATREQRDEFIECAVEAAQQLLQGVAA